MDEIRKNTPGYLEQLAMPFVEFDGSEGETDTQHLSAAERQERSTRARMQFEAMISGQSDAQPWRETFLRLMDASWPWRVAAYVAWAASPKKSRWPKTQDELAVQVLGLTSDRVIASWRKKYPDIDAAISVLQAAPMLEHRADVIAALVESASSPDHRSHQDRKLFFEMTGDYTPHTKIDVRDVSDEGNGLEGISEEELRQVAARAKEKRRGES